MLETAVSNWVVNWVEIFPEKRAFEQTPESREDVSYGDFQKGILGRGKAGAKALKLEYSW